MILPSDARLEIHRGTSQVCLWAEALEADFPQQRYAYEEQQRMPYITTLFP
jgi:hypothetical protein